MPGNSENIPASRKPRKTRDDLSENIVQPTHTRKIRQPTAAGAALNDRKLQDLVRSLRRENEKLKKNAQTATCPTNDEDYPSDEESQPESEDEPDASTRFPTSITALPTITPPSPKMVDLQKLLRKSRTTPRVHKVPRNILEPRIDNGPSSPYSSPSLLDSPSPPDVFQRWQPLVNSTPPLSTLPPSSLSSNSASSSTYKRARPPTPSGAPSAAPDPKRVKAVPAFSTRYVEGGRAKAGDYDPLTHTVILRTQGDYECRVIAIAPFPDSALQTKWAKSAWRASCRVGEAEFEVTERILRLIRARGSRIRGSLVGVVRTCVESCYGFDTTLSKKAESRNTDLHQKLMQDSAFAFKNVDEMTGFAEHRVVAAVISVALFGRGAESYGIVYKKHFDPISLATLALILTQVKFCISEFANGSRKVKAFAEKTEKCSYMAMLQDVTAWSELNPAVTLKIRKRLFAKAYNIINPDTQKVIRHVTNDVQERMRAELEARTGDTDSECEQVSNSELDEDEQQGQGENEADHTGGET